VPGHAAGDQALVTLSRRIDAKSRLSEIVAHSQVGAARLGGDEFIVLYRLAPDANIDALAARILEAATAPMQLGGQQYLPGISMGIALAPSHARDLDGLLRLADGAMYRAKSRGGRSYVIASPSDAVRSVADPTGQRNT